MGFFLMLNNRSHDCSGIECRKRVVSLRHKRATQREAPFWRKATALTIQKSIKKFSTE